MKDTKTFYAAILFAFFMGALGMWFYNDRQSDPFSTWQDDVFKEPFLEDKSLKDKLLKEPVLVDPFDRNGLFDKFSPLLRFDPGFESLPSNWPDVHGLSLSAGEDETHYYYRLPIAGKSVTNVEVKTDNKTINITAALEETMQGAVRKLSLSHHFPLPDHADEDSLQVSHDDKHIVIKLAKRSA